MPSLGTYAKGTVSLARHVRRPSKVGSRTAIAPGVHSNTPGIDARNSTSKLKSKSLTKLSRQPLEVAAKLPAVVSQERHRPALAKAGSERVEDAALWVVLLQNPAASDCLTKCCNILNKLTIYWGMV